MGVLYLCFLFVTMSLSGINLITWNVTGIMSSAAFLSQVLTEGDTDFCGLSEHWLLPHNVHLMDSLLTDYNHHSICSQGDDTKRPTVGRDGVSFVWTFK